MLLTTKFCIIQVLLVCLNYYYVSGLCPHAHKFYNVLSNDDDIQTIFENYMSPMSYDTYNTDCHRFVPQPPSISDNIIDHALNKAFHNTQKYVSLDIQAASGVCTSNFLTDMDRNNYYFEAATKYIQETTCLSKSTTSVYLPTLHLEQFKNFMTENITSSFIKNPSCSSENLYRNVDGTCNNLDRPVDGCVGDCMHRLLPPDYKDGVSQLRSSIDGSPLPNARLVSTNLLGQYVNRPWSTQLTQFHSLIGEFIISDNGMTLNHATGLLVNLQCCDHEDHLRIDHPQCAAFFIPPGDVLSQQYPKEKCMQFTRSIPCARCNLGPRLISNSVTAAQDLNSVYGVSTSMLNDRRTMADGCLKSQIINGHEMFAIERVNASGRYRCFNSKCELSPLDVRNVLAPTGLVFALLFHRNHNRHARKLAAIKPHWNDEKIFEEARKWNIAEYQHCVYNEYLETLIGTEFTDYFGILPKPIGQFSHYESDVQLKTIIEFQSTAGRHGHATLPEDISVIDFNSGSEVKYSLRQAELFERIFYDGLVDGMLLAQIMKPAFETTPSVPFKSFVLNTDGLDLGALDIQRQRDHGIPGYIHYLEYCHNVEIECWEDLEQFIDLEDIEKLKEYYKYVEDLELYVGGHYERKIADAVVGPTFACIIGIQFHNAKYGDRFFYEHGGEISSFSIEQIKEIKTKSSFASLLCKNTDLEHVLPDPFRIMSHTNNFVPCSEFDDIDYKL